MSGDGEIAVAARLSTFNDCVFRNSIGGNAGEEARESTKECGSDGGDVD